ncbi:MAG: hypothetical protein HYX76_01400 [Acidobacteria bacterium]|nr:hypothetical protein [Acidobacteriota bacterium]
MLRLAILALGLASAGVDDVLRPNAPKTAASSTALSVRGTELLLGGQPVFIVGVSLFDGLGLTPVADSDLDALSRWRISLVRVWAHWSAPIYGSDGALLPDGRRRLLSLVDRLEHRDLLLELVLLRPGQLPSQPYAVFTSADARLRAVRDITETLRPHRGIIFDLCNEHDHPDGPIEHAEARRLRDAVKAIDPSRLVTISSTAHHLSGRRDLPGRDERANLLGEAGTDAGSVNVDLLAPHFPRSADWAAATARRVELVARAVAQAGRKLPIYLNEENRARYGNRSIPSEDYLTAAAGAARAGAAGWVFHTDAGFALYRRRFLEAVSAEERRALELLAGAVR